MNLCKHTKFLALIKVNSHNEIIDIKRQDITLYLKREDLIHPNISGNKYRKLKYNIQEALTQNHDSLLTFGGAYSNHVAAVAYAGSICGLKTIGIIRGDELGVDLEKTFASNWTLRNASKHGMQFDFVSRETYRNKTSIEFTEILQKKYGDFYCIPEGGTNSLAVKGCEEILTKEDSQFDYICSCVGTGGTISGIINNAKDHQKVLGFTVLKGDFLENEILKYAKKQENWELIKEYHFGGYGKYTDELIHFINRFKSETDIPLDPIYTGKMMFGIVDMIKKNRFLNGSKILIIHSGGLQGIEGFNQRLISKQSGLKIL